MSAAGIPGSVPEEAKGKLKPDKTTVTVAPGKTETVTFTSSAGDSRTLLMLNSLAGIQAKLDQTEIKPEGRAVLTLEAGKDAKDGAITFVIPQTGEMFSIQVTVK
jgi:hypothetical protein